MIKGSRLKVFIKGGKRETIRVSDIVHIDVVDMEELCVLTMENGDIYEVVEEVEAFVALLEISTGMSPENSEDTV